MLLLTACPADDGLPGWPCLLMSQMGSSAARFHFFILPRGLKRAPAMDVLISHVEGVAGEQCWRGGGKGPFAAASSQEQRGTDREGHEKPAPNRRVPSQNALSPAGDVSAEQAELCFQAPRHDCC